MRAAASNRGITITSRSRPLTPNDIDEFDLLICMVRSIDRRKRTERPRERHTDL